jgi:hypothetical protein
MLQFSAWLVVMSSLLGVEPGSTDDEGSMLAADVFASADANKDGFLTPPEIAVARDMVADKMILTMPKHNFISGGERVVARMRKKIEQAEIDVDRNAKVDLRELAIFVNASIVMREQTARTPLEAQYQLMMEASKGKVNRHNWALEQERRQKEKFKYDMHYLAIKHRQKMLYEAEIIRQTLRAQLWVDYAAQRQAEKEAQKKYKEEEKPAPDEKPAEPAPEEKPAE